MTTLQTLVKTHQQRPVPSRDWSGRKDQWLDQLTKLLSGIKAELIAAGLPDEDLRLIKYSLNEESIGQYAAPGLTVRLGANEVVFIPKGCRIIGALGRVDVMGPRGRVKLIADIPEDAEDLSRSDQDWQWFVYPDLGSDGRFEFQAPSLARLLEMVLG